MKRFKRSEWIYDGHAAREATARGHPDLHETGLGGVSVAGPSRIIDRPRVIILADRKREMMAERCVLVWMRRQAGYLHFSTFLESYFPNL